jgi:phosphoribosyl-ATP pyrophosphohydrolase/phosphoribosyl-AMP cyclohydrolase
MKMVNANGWKFEGLIPAVIQNAQTLEVLMVGYMNQEAWEKTLEEKVVTFFSRSKQRLWTKGEESGHYLTLISYHIDCDEDTILIKALPAGPTCHTGERSCFKTDFNQNFIFELENIIADRFAQSDDTSYVNRLREKGLNKVAQKVGEEGVETVIAALAESRDDFLNESSDLLFHLIVLLRAKDVKLSEIAETLYQRHLKRG